jgi:hypothetical protein
VSIPERRNIDKALLPSCRHNAWSNQLQRRKTACTRLTCQYSTIRKGLRNSKSHDAGFSVSAVQFSHILLSHSLLSHILHNRGDS